MPTTVDYCKCPSCGNNFKMGFGNYWLSSLFGEYAARELTHKCEVCSTIFTVSAKKQIRFTTKRVK